MVGEIDCREGIPGAVAKGKYSSFEEAVNATVKVYRQVRLLFSLLLFDSWHILVFLFSSSPSSSLDSGSESGSSSCPICSFSPSECAWGAGGKKLLGAIWSDALPCLRLPADQPRVQGQVATLPSLHNTIQYTYIHAIHMIHVRK